MQPAIGSRHFSSLRVILAAVFIAGTGHAVLAKDNDEETADAIDEVVVVGEKSLGALRHAVHQAQVDFYDVFNELNSDDELDIHCIYVGARDKIRGPYRCKPNFLRAYNASGILSRGPDGTASSGSGPPYARIEKKLKALRKEMETLVKTNPKLLEAALKYQTAKDDYKQEREKRCTDDVLICS